MASADGCSSSGTHSFNLETTMPLRASKGSLGPFRATQIWNEMIQHMKSKVELKRRRYKMRYYDNSFTGTDAVDVILFYLLNDKETFSADLTREKAVKVCQLLMSKKAFEPVGCRHGDTSKHNFEDSGGKLYCFPADPANTENEPPADDSDDDSIYEDSDNALSSVSDSKRCSSPLEMLSEQQAALEGECDSRSVKSLTSSSSSCGSLRSLADNEHLENMASISKEVIEETWREVALAQLTTLIDLTFLDGVLAEDKPSKRQQQHHNLVISNVVARHWHLPLAQSLVNLNQVGLEEEEDTVLQTARDCIQCLPKGASILAERNFQGNDSKTKRQAFDIIRKHYQHQHDTILPARFFDLHMAVLNLILQGEERQAARSLRLDMVLLPLAVKEELHRLLKFMAALALDASLVLDSSDSNEVVVLRAFSNAIFHHKLLAPNLGSLLAQFMMQHLNKLFTVPRSLHDKVTFKLYHIKTGCNMAHLETAYCDRVSGKEYKRQARDCTQEGLVSMINSVLDDTKLSLKEKRQRLKQFQKFYPTLYEEHFSGMV